MDRSIKPGDDFYRYANGGWLKTTTIPAGQTSFDNRAILVEKTSKRVRDLIQEAAAANASTRQRRAEGRRLLRQLHGRRRHRVQGADSTGRRNGANLSDHRTRRRCPPISAQP